MPREKISNFPLIPFNSQIFIDAYRIKWVYDAESRCWKRVGTVPEIPLASEVQSGLLSRKLKEILDSIPEKGGHFGIIARPLLSVTPQEIQIKLSDSTYSAIITQSGSTVYGNKPKSGNKYDVDAYIGYFLRFTKGVLKDRTFLIYSNDDSSFNLDGDASSASYQDPFMIYNPLQANESGTIMGDIELISDTLDITCVDSNNSPINFSKDCRLDYKDNDGGKQAPGLDIKVSTKVLDSFCVELRSCKGPKGNKGDKGETGKDGTGDGPVGEQGNPGSDAPSVGHKFSGIKIIDSDDVYDTAVVQLELDNEAGKLNVIKSKITVPDDDTPATQVIASPIERSISWNDDEYGYEIMKPAADPIESKSADIALAALPRGYETLTSGSPEDIQKSRVTQFNSVKLSQLIEAAISHFKNRAVEIEGQYNKQIKEFIEERDSKARTILATLAQELAECEWQLPIEYCVTPDTAITMADWTSKNIINISVGETAIGSDGLPHKITKVMSRHVSENISVLTCSGTGGQLRLTNNHPIKLCEFDDARRIGHGKRKNYRHDLKSIDYNWSCPPNIRKNDVVYAPLPSFEQSYLSDDEAELLGYYAAEGDCKKYCTRFSLGLHENDFADRLISLGMKLGASSAKKFDNHNQHALTVYIYGKKISELCATHIGQGSRNKKLSRTILGLPRRQALTFIKAFFLGDGSVGKCGTGIRAQTTSASFDLINQLYWMLASHKIPSTKWFGVAPGGPNHRERVRIRGHLNLSKNSVSIIWPELANKSSVPQSQAIINDHIAIRVNNVATEFYDGLVYNLEVEDNHCYIANGIVVHNCVGITPDDCRDGEEEPGEGGTTGGPLGAEPYPNPSDIPEIPDTPYRSTPPINTVVPPPGVSPTVRPNPLPTPDPSPTPVPTPSPSPTPAFTNVWTGQVLWNGEGKMPVGVGALFIYVDGALRTNSSSYFVSPDAMSDQAGITIYPYIGGEAATPRAFPAINNYDPQDKNSVIAAYKTGGYDKKNYVVVPPGFDELYIGIAAKEELLSEHRVTLGFSLIFPKNTPPPGIKINMNTNVNETGGGTGTVVPLVKSVNPFTLPLGVLTSVELFGENFVVGPPSTTFNGQGPGTITIANVVVDSTTHATADITVSDGEPYDIVSVNPNGQSGVGKEVLTGQPEGEELLPIVTAVEPYQIQVGVATLVTIYGDNFVTGLWPGPGTKFIGQSSGGDITVAGINTITTKQATATITVTDAVIYDLVAINPDGTSGIGVDVISGWV